MQANHDDWLRFPWPPSTNDYWRTYVLWPLVAKLVNAWRRVHPHQAATHKPVRDLARQLRYFALFNVTLGPAGKKYRESVRDAAMNQWSERWPFADSVQIHVVLHPPRKFKFDLDNYQKSLFDALIVSGILDDDCLIDRMLVERGEPIRPTGLCRVRIEPYQGDQPHQRKFDYCADPEL